MSLLSSGNVTGRTNFDSLDLKFGAASATGGAATLNSYNGVITSEALTTAAAGEYTLTLTNDKITASSVIFCSAGLGSATAGTPGIGGVTPAAGSAVITVTNLHAANAFDGTIKVYFAILG